MFASGEVERKLGEAELRGGRREGGGEVFRFYSSADARRTGASWRAANPTRSFQGIIPSNDTVDLCVT